MDFKLRLIKFLLKCYGEEHKDNWDSFRFGKETQESNLVFIPKISNILNKRGYTHFVQSEQLINYTDSTLREFWKCLENSYNLLEDEYSKIVYVEIIAYKLLGYKKVKLSTNNTKRLELIDKIKKYRNKKELLKSNFKDENLHLFNFIYNNHSISFYTRSPLNTFFLKQYHLVKKVEPEHGDVVIDCGACWGDTPIEFATTVGNEGFVYAYEFIPRNLEIININLKLNPNISSRIKIIENAVWSTSDEEVYYIDNGPGSTVKLQKFEGYEGSCKSLTIDDLVKIENISKVDFIKMDIEGAEPKALKVALNTIKRFKPKLTIHYIP